VVDGCPPGIQLDIAAIQTYLDKRKPGQSRYTTQRKEPDQVRILSGVFAREDGTQVTTGTPIALEIQNMDARSKDYGDIKDKFRPGHADYTYRIKYGLRDWRGSGRASARETANRVAAGAIARKVVPGMTVRGALTQIGPYEIDRRNWDWDEVGNNPFFCPDVKTARMWGGAERAMAFHARGIEHQIQGVENALTIINLVLATGQVGAPGKGYGTITGQGNGQGGREHGQKADQLPGARDIEDPEHRAFIAEYWGIPEADLPHAGISAVELVHAFREGNVKGLLGLCNNPLV
jgi:hypothetical protein